LHQGAAAEGFIEELLTGSWANAAECRCVLPDMNDPERRWPSVIIVATEPLA